MTQLRLKTAQGELKSGLVLGSACDAYAARGPESRGLHSSTLQLNVITCCGIGGVKGVLRGCLGGVYLGVFRVCLGGVRA